MAKKKTIEKKSDILLMDEKKYICPTCRANIPLLPPCPKCGATIRVPVSQVTIDEIMTFLNENKGSQCYLMLGNRNGQPILVYELIPKGENNDS